MDEIQVFTNKIFGSVRCVVIDGDPWLVGKDVAECLGYASPLKALRDHVEKEDKGVTKLDTPGGKQEFITINESGLFSLIFSSQLKDAKKFKRWVTKEVLPTIRKHGVYITDEAYQEYLTNKDMFDKRISEAHEEIQNLRLENEELNQANELLTNQYNDIRLMKMNTTNEVAEYVEEQLVYSEKGKVMCAKLYANYQAWCDKQHHYSPYEVQKFEELIYYCLVQGHPIVKKGNYYIGIEVRK